MVYVEYLRREIDLNEWMRKILEIHFNPQEGTPYWLKKEKELGIDAKKDIETIEDLHVLGLMDEEDLRNLPAEELMPKHFAKTDVMMVAETGGATGAPKRAVWGRSSWQAGQEYVLWGLGLNGIPRGYNWLYAGPSGPHMFGAAVGDMIRSTGDFFYTLDLDPRFVRKLTMSRNFKVLEEYIQHIQDQVMAILRSQKVGILVTTSKILELLPQRANVEQLQSFKGIVHAGTSMSVDTYKVFLEEIYTGIPIMGIYGNTLFGAAIQRPFHKGDYNLDYYPMFPHFYYSVVDFDDPWEEVGVGETGQVKGYRFSEEFLIVNLLERDEGEKIGSNEPFEWDGVRNPQIIRSKATDIVEGVY
ncbi:MAG: hypothetical protein ACE5I5_02660 [Candidatus Heimdallarchaeota archaeon]